MSGIGQIHLFAQELYIEWEIDKHCLRMDGCVYSPEFSFANEDWCFQLYPNGSPYKGTVGYIDFHLRREEFYGPASVEITVSLMCTDRKRYKVNKTHTHVFTEKRFVSDGVKRLISRSDIKDRRSEFMPDGYLTIVAMLKLRDMVDTFGVTFWRCKEFCDVVSIPNWLFKDEELEETGEDAESKKSADFKKMLQDGIHRDLILKVGDKEIRVHKDILRARSQVFKSMLEHDMKENSIGVIDVPDCDPQAVEVFLFYVYSGKVDAFNANNMVQLYYIVDKYQMIDLKNECSNFIKRSLSPKNLCDVFQLALNHSDTDLFNVATEYFNNNVLEVLKTVEWQSFLKDNSTVANELFIKSYKKKTALLVNSEFSIKFLFYFYGRFIFNL